MCCETVLKFVVLKFFFTNLKNSLTALNKITELKNIYYNLKYSLYS